MQNKKINVLPGDLFIMKAKHNGEPYNAQPPILVISMMSDEDTTITQLIDGLIEEEYLGPGKRTQLTSGWLVFRKGKLLIET